MTAAAAGARERRLRGGCVLLSVFDAAWRRRALEGEAEAVRLLAETVLQPLYAFCLYRVGGDAHRCEEVVQETLVRALRELEHYDPARCGDNIFPWLTGLARNEISRVLKRDRRCVSLDALWTRIDRELLPLYERLEAEPLDEELLRREETCELVNMTLAQLPPRYREALEAKYVRGASVRDLATLWSSTEKAVESQLSRARKAFRATFLSLARHLGAEPF
jgi:RNA polymerase sigma-70 factor (ECF subfamily)